MVTIEPYHLDYSEQVARLKVRPEQTQFTIADVTLVIAHLQAREHPHLIIFNQQLLAFLS